MPRSSRQDVESSWLSEGVKVEPPKGSEPRCSNGVFDPFVGHMTLWSPLQAQFRARRMWRLRCEDTARDFPVSFFRSAPVEVFSWHEVDLELRRLVKAQPKTWKAFRLSLVHALLCFRSLSTAAVAAEPLLIWESCSQAMGSSAVALMPRASWSR